MITDINASLDSLCKTLGDQSLNYSVHIRLFSSPRMAGHSVAEILRAALGNRIQVGGYCVSNRVKILKGIRESLDYLGDDSSHPNRIFVASEDFERRKEEILNFFDVFVADANRLNSFWLKEGHPFYPVFWDFAFVIEKHTDCFVLIGSSSD